MLHQPDRAAADPIQHQPGLVTADPTQRHRIPTMVAAIPPLQGQVEVAAVHPPAAAAAVVAVEDAGNHFLKFNIDYHEKNICHYPVFKLVLLPGAVTNRRRCVAFFPCVLQWYS
jgi:hypothetical protein